MSARWFFMCIMAGLVLIGCQQQEARHPERHELYQDVKTARVIVRQSYGVHNGIALPFKSTVETWLRMAGVATVGDDSHADCVISIVAEGEPLQAASGASGGLYTGARLTGTIRIERPSLHQDELRFSGLVKPSRTPPGGDAVDYRKPEHAPFIIPRGETDGHPQAGKDAAAFDGFRFQLANLIGRYFGRSVLLIALDDHASKGMLRESAVQALAALGKPAVPFLIDAFRYCSPEAEQGIGEALEKITGEKYGSDAKSWNEWYSR